MQIIYTIAKVIDIIFLVYLSGNALYIFIFAIAGIFRKKPSYASFSRFRHITLLITAYKEDSIIEAIIKSALQQDYPAENINILLIADSFASETIDTLKAYPINLVIADFAESTKVHSLQLAMDHLPSYTEIVIVLDADNVMETNCLRKLNLAFESGFKVVQCHRSAKNTDTSFALLDAISEEVNNNIFRDGHRALGLSSALIGSAMAFDVNIFKEFIPGLTAIGGFDKELELKLLSSSVEIEYIPDAYVLDEKVQNSKVFYKQRRRWIASQLFYFGKDIFPSIRALISKNNFNYFDKTMQFSLFPRVMLLGFLFFMSLLNFVLAPPLFAILWLSVFIVCILAILFSVPYYFYRKETLKALFSLPKAFLLMFFILFKIRKANKQFIHTEHHYQSHL